MIGATCKQLFGIFTLGKFKDKDVSGSQIVIVLLLVSLLMLCCCGSVAYVLYQLLRHKGSNSRASIPASALNGRHRDDEDALSMTELMTESQIEQRITELEGV